MSVTDKEAVSAFQLTTKTEGIIPALESAHAVAHAVKIAGELPKDHIMIINTVSYTHLTLPTKRIV